MLTLLAAACANEGASSPAPCKLAHVTDLPLLYIGGVLATKAFLNDQPTTMMLDTGSFATIITKSAAERLHLDLERTGGSVNGIGGHQDLYSFNARSFRIGQLHGERLTLGSSALGLDARHSLFDGIFGADFLANYDVDFDLPEKKIRLFKVIAGCTTPSANLEEPLYLAALARQENDFERQPHVMVEIDGVRLNAVVDSGAHNTSIFRNAARRLGLRLEDLKTDKHGHAMGVGPEARDAVRHIMTPITIGEITIANLPVSIIDQRSDDSADMLLGLDFFARVHVWLAFHSHTMIMQYPAKPSPKLADETADAR